MPSRQPEPGQSLADLFPDVSAEWHPLRNEDLRPENVRPGSNKKVWWQRFCVEGNAHEWKASIDSRVKGTGCPFCAGKRILLGFNDLATTNPELVDEWHPTRNGDLTAHTITRSSSRKVWWMCRNDDHQWEATVASRTGNGSGCPRCGAKVRARNGAIPKAGESLADVFPEIAAEWHPLLNEGLTAGDVKFASTRRVWWQRDCTPGGPLHEWQASVNTRTDRRRSTAGCPVCDGKVVQPGVNDLASQRPDIAAEWHPTLNTPVSATDVTPGSNKMVWWRRECSESSPHHEWRAIIGDRTRGVGCAICRGLQIQTGVNDFASRHPEMAIDWHPSLNGDLSPASVSFGSKKMVWWQRECVKGQQPHVWQASILDRHHGRGCAVCAGHRVQAGVNDLETVRPEIAAQWDHAKNGKLTPRDVPEFSGKRVWWRRRCRDDEPAHEWQSVIANMSSNNGCPVCAGQVVQPGVNDLATVRPDVAAEWHPTKNDGLFAESVTEFSTKKVWWQKECVHGQTSHEWQATVADRSVGNGCPVCHGLVVQKGMNDLATLRPDLAENWHPTRNGDLQPSDVTEGSNRKVWWRKKCVQGQIHHEWESVVVSRSAGRGCSVCAGMSVQAGVNDLESQNPDAALDWHPTRNGSLLPSEVTVASAKRVWWECSKGHEWIATPNTRLRSACPSCSPSGFSPAENGWLYLLEDVDRGLLQIGITNFPENRLRTHRRNNWEVLDLRGPMEGSLAASYERLGLKALERRGAILGASASPERFDGYTESWASETLELSDLRQLIEWVRDDEF